MKIGKPKSKRTPVRLRHKIEKASAAKQRKQRKESKTNPQWRSRLKKDPGIPNLFPYKAQLLAEIEEGKKRKADEQAQRREQAKARRLGTSVKAADTAMSEQEDDQEADGGVTVLQPDEVDMEVDDQNPMAALLASAQARANTFDDDGESEEVEEDDDDWDGVGEATSSTANTPRALPKKALEDPVKAVTLLIGQQQKAASDSIQTMIDYYQLPPLVTSATDFPTRFLVEVARKRGRLGKGGVPNLHAAALVVLNDIHEERLQLPTSNAPASKIAASGVTIVKQMAAPFRLEGLWGDKHSDGMAVDG